MRRLIILLVLFYFIHQVDSQTLYPEVFSCFGGYAKNATVQLTWTVGESLYTTIQNNTNILTQGFNQIVYIINETTDIDEIPGYIIKAYPNPTTSIINISFYSENHNILIMNIMDIQGKNLILRELSNDFEQIDLSKFASGTYILKISDNKQVLKTFKIQKVQ